MKRLLLLFSMSLLCTFNVNAQITDFINDVSTTVGVYKSGNTLYIGSVGNSIIYTADLSSPNPVAEDLITGFQYKNGNRWARPADVITGPDGEIYFTSDANINGLFRLKKRSH